jgi:hypothetical protein
MLAMWTLLCAVESERGRAKDAEPEPAPIAAESHTNGAAVPNGVVAQAAESLKVRVFMCPGRIEIGVMDLRQAAEQFDLGRARGFDSLSEADPVCGRSTGFLLEVCGGDNRSQVRSAPKLLFVERLRH